MNKQKLIELRCKAWGITEDEYYCNQCSDFSLEDMARAYRRGKNKGARDKAIQNVGFYQKQMQDIYDKKNKQIAELEKENAELRTRCNELFLQNCEQAEKIKELKAEIENDRDLPAIAYMQGAEKQKKKDEEELQKWKDEWQEQVQKATDEGYARTLQTIQLSKAKEIIKMFLAIVNNDVEYVQNPQDCKDLWKELCENAEQFISEVEK